MKFFTDKSVKNPFLIIKIKDYLKLKIKEFSKWKEVFIEPAVYELVNSDTYSFEKDIDIKDFLNILPYNHYFSFDYPSDMNMKYQDLFLEKSWNNAVKYHNHSQYIITVQYKHNDFWNFIDWFDKYNNLDIKSGILGLGNLCKFKYLNEYLENVLDYAFSCCKHSRIHIYGLCIKSIPLSVKLSKRYNINLSIDSVKWTRACTIKLKEKYGINCTSSNRQEFFDTYIDLIKLKIKNFNSIPE